VATVEPQQLPNGLPLHRISLPGTRAITALVAFDAGARTERPRENGIAHFLEHMVFKGGEKYPTYRDVNETAERLGAQLNAYTSHDLVAFHITARAQAAPEAIDLLSDFVGRPGLDPDELERERGVVIQEIARAHDQPSMVAEHLIDTATFGDHPLGRMVLGTEEHLRRFQRDDILAFRERRWAPARGAAFLVGNLDHLPGDDVLEEIFGRFAQHPAPDHYEPAPAFSPETLVERRETNQSHLRMAYRLSLDASDRRTRAALAIYSTLLGGSMGSRLFDEIREQRGLCYSVWAVVHALPDAAVLSLGSGLDSSKCIEAFTRMREIVAELASEGPTEEELQRARAYAAGRRVLAFENTNAVASHAAHEVVVFGDDPDPDLAIAELDAVSFDQVAAVARAAGDRLAIACVGPHEAGDFADSAG
jgi:predicted Zn-dependent peptidase